MDIGTPNSKKNSHFILGKESESLPNSPTTSTSTKDNKYPKVPQSASRPTILVDHCQCFSRTRPQKKNNRVGVCNETSSPLNSIPKLESPCLPPLKKLLVSTTSITTSSGSLICSPTEVPEVVVARQVLPRPQQTTVIKTQPSFEKCSEPEDNPSSKASGELSAGSSTSLLSANDLQVEGDQWTLINTLLTTAKEESSKKRRLTKSCSVDGAGCVGSSNKAGSRKFVITGTRVTHGHTNSMQNHDIFVSSRYRYDMI